MQQVAQEGRREGFLGTGLRLVLAASDVRHLAREQDDDLAHKVGQGLVELGLFGYFTAQRVAFLQKNTISQGKVRLELAWVNISLRTQITQMVSFSLFFPHHLKYK